MHKRRNKISTTKATGVSTVAALSFFAMNTTCEPHIIIRNQERESISLNFQSTPTSTRFNNANRYSLEKLRSNKKILKNLRNLKSNWNGYGGEPIDQAVIIKTEELISNLDFQPQIFPTGRGSIQIEYFKNDDNLIEIEISKDELFVYKVEEGEDFEGNMNFDDISGMITSFYA
ncbi:MAG: hypothetical protein WD431_18475 [Cyclobacteriaceae bacterium]